MYVNAEQKKTSGLHLFFLVEEDKPQNPQKRLERWLSPAHVENDNAESKLHNDPFYWTHHDEGCWCLQPLTQRSMDS